MGRSEDTLAIEKVNAVRVVVSSIAWLGPCSSDIYLSNDVLPSAMNFLDNILFLGIPKKMDFIAADHLDRAQPVAVFPELRISANRRYRRSNIRSRHLGISASEERTVVHRARSESEHYARRSQRGRSHRPNENCAQNLRL